MTPDRAQGLSFSVYSTRRVLSSASSSLLWFYSFSRSLFDVHCRCKRTVLRSSHQHIGYSQLPWYDTSSNSSSCLFLYLSFHSPSFSFFSFFAFQPFPKFMVCLVAITTMTSTPTTPSSVRLAVMSRWRLSVTISQLLSVCLLSLFCCYSLFRFSTFLLLIPFFLSTDAYIGSSACEVQSFTKTLIFCTLGLSVILLFLVFLVAVLFNFSFCYYSSISFASGFQSDRFGDFSRRICAIPSFAFLRSCCCSFCFGWSFISSSRLSRLSW
jgi:hypothetical protein